MNHLEGTKSSAKISAAVAIGATHSHEIDTYGSEYLSVDVAFSPFTATNSQYATVLKLQQSDASGSGQVDISGMTVAAGAGATTGAQVGAVARFNLDTRAIKRYVTVVASPGAAATIATVARLSKLQDEPYNAATAGVNNYVSG